MAPLDDVQGALQPRQLRGVHRPCQAVQARRGHGQHLLASDLVELIITALQADGAGLANGVLVAEAPQGHLQRLIAPPGLERHLQGGIGLKLAQAGGEDLVGRLHRVLAPLVKLLQGGELVAIVRLAQFRLLRRIKQAVGLAQGLAACFQVVGLMEGGQALGQPLDVRRGQIGMQPSRQDLGRPRHPQHIDHRTVDQGRAAGGNRQGIDRVKGPGADMLAQLHRGIPPGRRLHLAKEGAGTEGAHVVFHRRPHLVVQVLLGLGHVQVPRLDLGGAVDILPHRPRLLFDFLELDLGLDQFRPLFGLRQAGLDLGGEHRFAQGVDLGLERLAGITALADRLPLTVTQVLPPLLFARLGLALQLLVAQALGLRPFGILGGEAQALLGRGGGIVQGRRRQVGSLQGRGPRLGVGRQVLALQVHRLVGALEEVGMMLLAQPLLGLV